MRKSLRAFWTGNPAVADVVGQMWRPVERTLRASISEWFLSAGRAAKLFVDRHGGDIGVRETLDVARLFTDGRKPKVRVSVTSAESPEAAVI